MFVNEQDVLESQLDAEIEYPQVFVQLVEADRRDRALRLDLGDETAKLKLANWGNDRNHGKSHNGGQGWNQQYQGGNNWSKGGNKGGGNNWSKDWANPGVKQQNWQKQ